MLKICNTIFKTIPDSVRYCHWKSNLFLDDALSGKTDLDILVHAEDQRKFEEHLIDCGCIPLVSPAEKQIDGLADFIGFDSDTGGMIHLHVHYKLILGEKYIKNHHLPIEDFIFDNLIERNGIFIPRPEVELFILLIRAHLKLDIDALPAQIDVPVFPDHIHDEFKALMNQCSADDVVRVITQSGVPVDVKRIPTVLDAIRENHLSRIETP